MSKERVQLILDNLRAALETRSTETLVRAIDQATTVDDVLSAFEQWEVQ